ncbi:MAG: YihY/virulence factor BrkB family protein [Actinomycetota bacterium]
MSSANGVPETRSLSGDDAWETLSRTGRLRLVGDAFRRFRAADGFSHARSMAFIGELVLVQGVIVLVGLASAIHRGGLSDLIVRTLKAAAPGPAGTVLTQAVNQAHRANTSHRYLALTIGLFGALISGTTLMGQMERGLNRLYGIERDRPTLLKYGRALVLAASVGLLVAAAFTAIAFGRQIARSLGSDFAVRLWEGLRWPLAMLLVAIAIGVMFRVCPRRAQPRWPWLAFGATISVFLWVVVTVLLALFFSASATFGQTYGPLAGIVALILWALASSIAVLFGGAVAAQLEAVRAGASSPRRIPSKQVSGARSTRVDVDIRPSSAPTQETQGRS